MTEKDYKKLEESMSLLNKHIDRIKDPNSKWCSFCGKERSEVKQLFSGPVEDLYICDECVSKCYRMLNHDTT
jgi:hypothetical protein